jgi:hypothetical protein
MRTILFIGLLSIADAINPNWMNKEYLWFYAIAFFGAIIGDIFVTKFK